MLWNLSLQVRALYRSDAAACKSLGISGSTIANYRKWRPLFNRFVKLVKEKRGLVHQLEVEAIHVMMILLVIQVLKVIVLILIQIMIVMVIVQLKLEKVVIAVF